jgi:segregation and condensation protein A
VNLSAEDAVEIEQLAIEPAVDAHAESDGPVAVRELELDLDAFEGPFDLLLSLISRRQLDVTEVALSQVTDEFISYLDLAGEWNLGQATEFLVVAATLVDLKAARLLPAADVADDEDLELLEARDLLFARLLQYRAYKLAAAYLRELERGQELRHARSVGPEPAFAQLVPDVQLDLSLHELAECAALALRPKPMPVVATEHLHVPRVSVAEHMAIMRELLRRHGAATFRSLVADCTTTLEVVDDAELDGAVEAVLFVVDAPISAAALADAVQAPAAAVRAALARLRAGYQDRGAGIELREVAGGVRIYTRPAHAEAVTRYLQDGQRQRLSQAALETLAVIAYRQPVTRARVSAVRGVNVDGVVRTLVARGLVVEAGTDSDSTATLYRTTGLLLERLGLRSLEELPSLAPFLPDLGELDTSEG